MTRQLKFLHPASEEWVRAWSNRQRITRDSDPEAFEPESGEVWQYMGSIEVQRRWVHQFRHRCHPSTHDRWLVNVPASPDWVPPELREALDALEHSAY